MKPIRLACPDCHTKVSVPSSQAGLSGYCPRCAATIQLPLLGIGRGKYWALKFAYWISFALLAGLLREGAIFIFPIAIAAQIYLAVLRGTNIGFKPLTAGLIGLIPFSCLYLGVEKPGAVIKRNAKAVRKNPPPSGFSPSLSADLAPKPSAVARNARAARTRSLPPGSPAVTPPSLSVLQRVVPDLKSEGQADFENQ